MDLYICATPYHVLVSLGILYHKRKEAIFYLSTHDKNVYEFFKDIESEIADFQYVNKVLVRKRNRIKEKLYFEKVKDQFEYIKLKKVITNSESMYNFIWNPFSLYSPSNYIYKKFKNDVFFIEEGANLYSFEKPTKLKLFIKKVLFGISTDFYRDKKLKKIIVHYPEKYSQKLQNKLERFSLNDIINKLDTEQRMKISKTFISEIEINKLLNIRKNNKIVIILTQPLSEDGYITEQRKKQLYKEIVEHCHNDYNIIIKRHPREKTKYEFENTIEVGSLFPSEIFNLLNIKFTKAIGICTSAIYLIDAEEKINTNESFFKKGEM